MNYVPPSERAGLQAERTDLSWARTSLSFLVNGGLLVMRQRVTGSSWLSALGAVLAVLLLVFTLYMSRRRRRVLERHPLPRQLADPWGLCLLAGGTGLLGLVVIVELLLE